MIRPLGGYNQSHPTSLIEEPHLGVTFNYKFAGRSFKPDSLQVSLLLWTYIYDHQERLYERRSHQIVYRKEVKALIKSRIEEHLIDLGVDPVQRKGLMRDWAFDISKCIPYDELDNM